MTRSAITTDLKAEFFDFISLWSAKTAHLIEGIENAERKLTFIRDGERRTRVALDRAEVNLRNAKDILSRAKVGMDLTTEDFTMLTRAVGSAIALLESSKL